jgi:hypothetical protein
MPTLPPNPSAAATSEGPLVLIVDDDEDTRFLYSERLVHLGHRTAREGDARRGIEAAFRLRPDAILPTLRVTAGVSALAQPGGSTRSSLPTRSAGDSWSENA